MSAPGGAPSPGPRSGSMGPNNPLPTPTQQQPMSSAPPAAGGTPTTTTSSPAVMSQQNLNQIVIDYLAKKGYNRTEMMLRMESASQEIDGRPLPPVGDDSRTRFRPAFDMIRAWVENNLDIYKASTSFYLSISVSNNIGSLSSDVSSGHFLSTRTLASFRH
ncbi:Transcription initiation factor TFIID subunit 5 [Coccidioides posadasii str. Silveira]|uniref:Transcription initiation factor TFIID subunit 5 n=1 Tax=Coccidioides posadasii (strain RMSCC 757 / Silveira) TaxID=443226 RepID=UPI001BF0D4BC|nr:Transcription initiation factor TFIID subunit 5 [Coccidioides posadasii str. Silveira]